jgi:hypothetical protein
MATFDALDHFLGLSFSDDHWSDVAIFEACALIRSLSAPDWTLLEYEWQSRSGTWQARCADVLPHGDPARALGILLKIMHAEARDARLSALDSLREYDLNCLSDVVKVQVMRQAQELLAEASKVETGVIRALIDQLSTRN